MVGLLNMIFRNRIFLNQTQFCFQPSTYLQPTKKTIFNHSFLISLPNHAPKFVFVKVFKSTKSTESSTLDKTSKKSKASSKEKHNSRTSKKKFQDVQKETQIGRKYSKHDDQLIVQAVALNGDERKTFVRIATVLGLSDPVEVENRYRNKLANQALYSDDIPVEYPTETINDEDYTSTLEKSRSLDYGDETKTTSEGDYKKMRNTRYTAAEDEIILQHASKYGKTAVSIKELADILNRDWISVRNKMHRLTKSKEKIEETSKSSKTSEKIEKTSKSSKTSFSFEEKPLLEKNKKQKIKSQKRPEETPKLKADKKPTRRRKRYSVLDDKTIIEAVKLYGDKPETFRNVTSLLGMSDPRDVEIRYRSHLASETVVKGRFSKQEDKYILDYIAENGDHEITLKKLASDLNRGSWKSIRSRLILLRTDNEYDRQADSYKSWNAEDDRKLIKCVLSLKQIKTHDIDALEGAVPQDFLECGKDLKRSTKGCYMRWNQIILPSLKTYILGLPLNNDWKLDLMTYILDHKIKRMKDLDDDFLLTEKFPGQTRESIVTFVQSISLKTEHNFRKRTDEPLYELVEKKMKHKSIKNPLFNEEHKTAKKQLETIRRIVDIYLDSIGLLPEATK